MTESGQHGSDGDQDALADELARVEAELEALDRQREAARARAKLLRERLAASSVPTDGGVGGEIQNEASLTSIEKIQLFRSLFRGRSDVFATRFVSRRTGRPGYAPACSNKFVRGVCDLPNTRCGDCRSQAFVPVGDDVVFDHLIGRHVMGIYPVLEDETCWLLAVDFDKTSWREDVAVFRDTARAASAPCVVERSQSGNGAHAWFFFASPIPAATARKLGCYLITEAMSRRYQLRMDSYDRLFPNQDTLPRGGFGSLIALPLQHEARMQGNTLFVGDNFEPYADPWSLLARVRRLTVREVEAIAQEATRAGLVVGVRQIEPSDEESEQPWLRSSSRALAKARTTEPVPAIVRAVQAQRIYVEKAGLPSSLLNAIKRLAAFQNPEFYKKQRLRLSTARTPRVIVCAEDFDRHIALPRGCLEDLRSLVSDHGIKLILDDRREDGQPLNVEFHGDLTKLQQQAERALSSHETGVVVAPPGVGKTVLGAHLIAKRGRSTLVLVHRRQLLDQWLAQLSMFLGIREQEIGRLGGGKSKLNGRLDVAMIQSLVRRDVVSDVVANYGHVVVDECHHVPAVSFERVLSEVKARYVLGLTATPHRRDGHQPIFGMQIGPVRFSVNARSQAAARPFEHRLFVRETSFCLPRQVEGAGIQDVYRAIARDEARNKLIVSDVREALVAGRSPMVLTERRDHLERLAELLQNASRHLVVLRGGMTARKRKSLAEQLDAARSGEKKLVLATGRYVGEGFDNAELDTLFLTMPVSWKGTLVQYAGRLHRYHATKTEVRIYDYVDSSVPRLVRMFERRLKAYRAIGYSDHGRESETRGLWENRADTEFTKHEGQDV